MNKWTIDKLERKIENWQRKTPAPFPGKYPTRVMWVVSWQLPTFDGKIKQKTAAYIGKPNKLEVERLQRLQQEMSQKGWITTHLLAGEFDRLGWVSQSSSSTFGLTNWRASNQAGYLKAYYHPWDPHDTHLSSFVAPHWVKRIKGKLRIHSVYSPMERLKEQDITDYKVGLSLGAERVKKDA